MVSADYQIAVATRDDIASILALQEENLPENGRLLSVRLPFQWFEAALEEMPIILVLKNRQMVGYLIASALSSQAHLPIIQSMMRAYSALPDAYLYGPICVAASERGRGLPTQFVCYAAKTTRQSAVLYLYPTRQSCIAASARQDRAA